MAFQFQSVAALSPLLIDSYGVSLADIGFLVGLYLAPGVIVAIPGGAMAAWIGDKRFVSLSMILMALGGMLIIWAPDWWSLTAGRLLAGAGGVALNVVMTKMVLDWFAGREISTAMGIFINSWPIGITLALLILPIIAETGGLHLAWTTVLITIVVCLALFLIVYRPAPDADTPTAQLEIVKFPAYALFLAGTIWALYNTALAMIFSFGPALLTERGLSLTSASSMTSLFMLIACISVPFGGYIADRSGRRDTVILVSLASYVVLMPLVLLMPITTVPVIFLVAGLFYGLAAGPIVGLPSAFLPQRARAFGMGVYYMIYYVWMMTAPAMAGKTADLADSVGAVIIFGIVVVLISIACLMLLRRTADKAVATV